MATTVVELTRGIALTEEEVDNYPKAFKFSSLDPRIRSLLKLSKEPNKKTESTEPPRSPDRPRVECPVGPHIDPALGELLLMACAECKESNDHKVVLQCTQSHWAKYKCPR